MIAPGQINMHAEESLTSWTDDIPICKQAGIGTANSEIYRKDGKRVELHPMQDRYFHFRQDEYDLSLYGLFDGFNGSNVSDFACKRIPAELLLGQLMRNSSDETVRDVLRQAFINVDREYFESIMDTITSRMVLKQDHKVTAMDPTLQKLDLLASIGASATVAVILKQRLYVAGCGDTKAILCVKSFQTGELKAVKMTVEHVIGNEDEELRLRQIGLGPTSAEAGLGPDCYTRCLGNHQGKGGYKEVDALAGSSDEPVIPEPEIHGGLPVEESFQFLLIFSRSLTDCLSQLLSLEGNVADELCRITHDQFSDNSSVTAVAQSVVDKVVRMHREQFEFEEEKAAAFNTREDISLLVRRFNAKLGGKSHGKRERKKSSGHQDTLTSGVIMNHQQSHSQQQTGLRPTLSSTTTESSEVFAKSVKDLPVDENGRIKPYVDFSHFNREYKKYKDSL